MDTRQRLLVKALTWQALGFVLMLGIGWVFTGSVSAGGGIAIAGTILGFCTYFLHELLWSKVAWGRATRPNDRAAPLR